MRILAGICLLIALLAQTFSKTIIFFAFKTNQDFIAQNLCENRLNPGMHCNGKCHLRKQLQKDEQKNPTLPSALKTLDEALAQSEEPSAASFIAFFSGLQAYADYHTAFTSREPADIFHPPC